MTKRDKPHPADKPPTEPASDTDPKTAGVSQEPGTEGPDGALDDQPQREDEYLSSLLKEFNPQRKDESPTTLSDRNSADKPDEQGGDIAKKKDPS